jgi:hypothetical protein
MSTIKIGWGTRIAILYSGFVLLIATLVVGSMRQDFDLVSTDYYEQELRYQDVIDAGRNQSALSEAISLNVVDDMIILQFPKEFSGRTVAGKVSFYSPVNASWDRSFDIAATDSRMLIPTVRLRKTAYKAKINWRADGKDYYQESSITLKP